MAPVQAPVLYTETRLDLSPASATSTVDLRTSHDRSPKRAKYHHDPTDLDEAAFARTHLANASSIYFRRPSRSPRTFLWRILEERKVLEIQAVDLTQDKNIQGDAILTLRVHFDSAIKPFGVAFADPDEKDALVAFVITESNELLTLTLKKELWVDKRRVEKDGGTDHWCKVFHPSVFSFRRPYRLFAINALELVVSLQDGTLLKLQRNSGDDGSHWRDTFFTDGGWKHTIKGMMGIKSQNRIPFGSHTLEPSTAASASLSPDQQHYITVGLDHTLRAWNLQTGKIGLQADLLGDNEISEKKVQYLIGAEQNQLLQILEGPGSNGVNYWVITYSPKQHQFKIWGILDADSGLAGLRDETDTVQLVPPLEELLDTSVWSLEEFHFVPKHHWQETDLWIRVRSGPLSRVFHLRFDLTAEPDDLQSVWRSNWVTVDGGSSAAHRLNLVAPGATEPFQEPTYESTTDEWIAFLLHPGRFDKDNLIAALGAYTRPTRTQRVTSSSSLTKPLKQRITEAVFSTAQKQHARIASGEDTLETIIATQWRVFYSLVKDFLKRQSEPLSLAYDATEGLPWLVRADFISPIRSCSDLETLKLNSLSALTTLSQTPSHPLSDVIRDEQEEDIARVLNAAGSLRSGLPTTLRSVLRETVINVVLEEPSEDIFTRIQGLDASLDLCAQVSDEEYNRFSELMGGVEGFSTLNDNVIMAILDGMAEQLRGLPGRLAITRYGAKALSRGAQETLALAVETLLDVLVLLIFVTLEVEPADLSPQLHAHDMFAEIVIQLKEQLLLEWLTTALRPDHTVVKPRKQRSSGRSSSLSIMEDATEQDDSIAVQEPGVAQNVFESVFIGDAMSNNAPQDKPKSALLTYWIRAWLSGLDIRTKYDDIAAHVLTHLVKTGDVEIAEEFERFVTVTPWAGYVIARLALLKGDFETAARLFKSSSFGLATSPFNADANTPSLLLLPHEKNSFAAGLSAYYAHVLTLYQALGAHSYVVDFAGLGLESLPVVKQLSAEHSSLRSELLARLFAACMATSRFDEAYACLNDMPAALRRANLSTFLTAILSEENASIATDLLKRLPFAQTYNDADAILESLASKALAVANNQGDRYHKALYALRVSRGDMRGAATALWNRLVRLRSSTERVGDPESAESQELLRCYLALINSLACVDDSQAWIFSEDGAVQPNRGDGTSSNGVDLGKPRSSLTLGVKGKDAKERRVVTLQDIRTMYQEELDRIEAVNAGRYAFDGGEDNAMDVL